MPRPILNLGLDADMSFAPYLNQIGTAFGALGFPRPLLLCYTKIITPTTLSFYEAAGFPVALIFEIGAQNSLGGAAQGTIDGTRCVAQMQALGARPNSGVFLTSDTDVASVQDIETTEDYWAAADVPIFAAGFRIGGYADGTELMALHSKGLNFEWAAGAASWDGTRDFEATGNPDIVQGIISAGGTWAGIKWPVIAGLNYDPNVIYSADVGQL